MKILLVLLSLLQVTTEQPSTSNLDQRLPGQILVSYSPAPPVGFIESFESSLGLIRTASYNCNEEHRKYFGEPNWEHHTCPFSFYQYSVTPRTEIIWLDVLQRRPFVFRATWSEREQLKGPNPVPFHRGEIRYTKSVTTVGVQAKAGIHGTMGLLASPGKHIGGHVIAAGRDELCAESYTSASGSRLAPEPKRNRAGWALFKKPHTIHDLLVTYVKSSFPPGAVRVVKDHQHRLVFMISRVKGEILRSTQFWEQLELEVFFFEPNLDKDTDRSCIEIDLTINGKYAAYSDTVPSDGFFNPMEREYAKEEQEYTGEFAAKLKQYLIAPADNE